jgi:hypothetical protein
MTSEKSVEVLSFPPAYAMNDQAVSQGSFKQEGTKKSKALFGYAVGVTTALIVVLVLGGIYYYRSIDVLQESIKKFRLEDNHEKYPVHEEVELDIANNYIVFFLTGENYGPGTLVALDYTKSMIGIYDAKLRRCYLVGGIRSEIGDLQSFQYLLENNTSLTDVARKVFYHVIGDSYPVSDKKILPYHLKTPCANLPVYWLEPASPPPNGLQKRSATTSYQYGGCCCKIAL